MKRVFIVRLDDICPTMNWAIWERVESILQAASIKPILAVIPDNRNPKLDYAPAKASFWDEVSKWKSWGWTIAMHGYDHSEQTRDPGLMKVNRWSEFAGLSTGEQLRRIEAGMKIFSEHDLEPRVWAAPGHSFDSGTLGVLANVGFSVVSDGFFIRPVTDERGLVWVPQQLWRFRNMPFGIWTVALHINTWTERDIDRLQADLERFAPWISDLETVLGLYPGRPSSPGDKVLSIIYPTLVRFRRALDQAKRGPRTKTAIVDR